MNKNVRIVSRAIVFKEDKILLVKNKNANFWYVPGGGWESETESLKDCVIRETKEETGLDIENPRIVYIQEYKEYSNQSISLEVFWVCDLSSEDVDFSHKDQDENGQVEEFNFYTKEEIQSLKIYPKVLKNDIWDKIKNIDNFVINYLTD